MAKPSKIEQLGLQSIVASGIAAGKSPRTIAQECSRKAKQTISHMSVVRYMETVDMQKRKETVIRNPEKLARIVEKDIDLIEMQYRTTSVLLDKFEQIVHLPALMESRLDDLAALLKRDDSEQDTGDWDRWKLGLVDDIRRNVQNISILNRELRENSKFMSELREKAFEFSLVQEYLYLFMEVFRKAAPDAYEESMMQIAANPRMQRIVEQQQQLRGGDAE